MPGFVAPQLVGLILVDSTVLEWQTVFWVRYGGVGGGHTYSNISRHDCWSKLDLIWLKILEQYLVNCVCLRNSLKLISNFILLFNLFFSCGVHFAGSLLFLIKVLLFYR